MINSIYNDALIIYPYQFNHEYLSDIVNLIQSELVLKSNTHKLDIIEYIYYKDKGRELNHSRDRLIYFRMIRDNRIVLISLLNKDFIRLQRRLQFID